MAHVISVGAPLLTRRCSSAVERCQRDDGREDLPCLFDDAIAALATVQPDPRTRVQAAAAAASRPTKPKAVAAKRER